MKVTLTHDGKSVELDLTAEQMTALGLKEEKKKTGYERRYDLDDYWFVDNNGQVKGEYEGNDYVDADRWDSANYYSDEDLALANARADRLMRRLRRFAAENGGIPSREDWKNTTKRKYNVGYCYDNCVDDLAKLYVDRWGAARQQGAVYFNSKEAAEKAIELYHDELIWYFTEYEAMLR